MFEIEGELDILRERGGVAYTLGDRPVWVCKDGRRIVVPNMETTHIRNSLAQILLRANGWRAAYVPILVAELERRGNV